jgi:hypothetical protein
MTWRAIGTAPTDGSHFLAWCVDTVDEYDEDDRIVAKGQREAYAVVAYHIDFLGGFVRFPWSGSVVRNREYLYWRPLPEPPPGEVAA